MSRASTTASIPAAGHDPLARLYEQAKERLLGYARQRLPDPDTAEDLVQQVFTSTLQAVIHEPGRAITVAYLYRSLSREIARYHQGQRRVLVHEPARLESLAPAVHSAEAASAVRMEHFDRRAWLADAVATLPTRARQVLALQLEGYSYCEIADRLGLAKNTVNTHLQHARKRLRQHYLTAERERERERGV